MSETEECTILLIRKSRTGTVRRPATTPASSAILAAAIVQGKKLPLRMSSATVTAITSNLISLRGGKPGPREGQEFSQGHWQ